MTTATRAGGRQRPCRQGCMLMVSIGITAAELSREWCVRMGHLPFEDRTEVGAEKLQPLLSGPLLLFGHAHPKYEELP